jgi:uncharacterized protein (DUF427 family)
MEPSPAVLANRAKWTYNGGVRPPFAEIPEPAQRSVWDFPRPPRIAPVASEVGVVLKGRVIGNSRRAVQVLETGSPPTIYLPPADVACEWLRPCNATTLCEWKGLAHHFDLEVDGTLAEGAAWSYADPFPEFASIRGWLSFHPGRVERCFVGDETVKAQPGGYYGGWITRDLVGPWKGGPGTDAW